MEKEMRTLYIEGLAIHGGPESCVDVREGGGEALTGVRAGWAMEPRNHVRGADALITSGRPCPRRRYREPSGNPARSENPGTHGVSMRENREVPRSPAGVDDAPSWMVRGVAGRRALGREGNAKAVSPR
jgi:hypothetical protein